MKDMVISSRRLRIELWMLLLCLVLAFAVNAYAILTFKTHWIELLTTWRVTGAVALVIYILSALLRLIFAGVKQLFRRQAD